MSTPSASPQGSATTWTRLEPQTRSADLREGAAARVADAAWLLARQWQFGEFHGSDGGSPAGARLRLSAGVLSGYRALGGAAGRDAGDWMPYAQRELPLEVLVERERLAHTDLRLRADGGRHFLRLLEHHGAGAQRAAFTSDYALPAALPGAPESPESAALLAVLAGRVPDADALATAFASLSADPPGLPARPPVPAADRPRVLAAATAWLAWWRALVDRAPDGPQAWDDRRMEHAFALGAQLGEPPDGVATTLVAAEYPGGSLDWYDLEVAADATSVAAPVPGSALVRSVLPTPVRYPGMPASRFWQFENARVFLGGIEAGAADLGRMLLSEFALLYSDDWFVIPVQLAVGTIARVDSLVVTDTFGVRTHIGEAAHGDWDMFRLAAAGPAHALFVLPPTLADTQEGAPVEEVVLLRDENANVVWGVERLVESAAGTAVDRHAQYLAALRAAAERPVAPALWPPDPPGDLSYRLRAGVPPAHWLALLAQPPPPGEAGGLRLVLGALADDAGTPIRPAGELLGATDWLAAEEVPRDGIRVVRQWQLARGSDGATHLWRTRRKLTGRGEAASGLRYDALSRSSDDAPPSAPRIDGRAQAGVPLRAVVRTWTTQPPPYALAFQWRRCDAGGEACLDIAGATGATYTPGAADVGATLRLTVTATGAGRSFGATSEPTSPVDPPATPPASVAPPQITGRPRFGDVLVAVPGQWRANPAATLSYAWHRCDATGDACAPIAGATGSSYQPVALDQGHTLRVVESAQNALGRASAGSPPSPVVGPPPAPPAIVLAPSIFGAPTIGRELQADLGRWSGEQPVTLDVRWQGAGGDDDAWKDVPEAVKPSYEVRRDDVGLRLRVVVTASNSLGSAEAASAPTARVPPPPDKPVNVKPPSIDGAAGVGRTLTAVPGEWSGSAPRFAYQWLRCDALGRNARPIEGQRSALYRAVAADAGSTLRVEVIASNDAGSAIARSEPSEIVATPPAATAPPAISGAPELGATLTASPGTWAGTAPVLFAYRWLRCAPSGGACTDIAGASGPAYALQSADVGASIRVEVIAANAAGQATMTAANVGPIGLPAPPANVVAPSIGGSARVGQTLTVDPGQWSGSPVGGWSFAWRRCDAGGGQCTEIDGATAPAYVVTAQDGGATLRAAVTATNAVGSASATSAPSALVPGAAAPANTLAPAITGTPLVGEQLAVDPGLWSGEPTRLAYAWSRCDADGKDCVPISEAEAATYALTDADAGQTIEAHVTAFNAAGSGSASAPLTAVVRAAERPANTVAPSIIGEARVGTPLTADPGRWSGEPQTFGHQWLRLAPEAKQAEPIEDATQTTYVPRGPDLTTAGDIGCALLVSVTARNAAGSAAAISTATAPVLDRDADPER